MRREIALKILEQVRQNYDKIAEDFSRTRKSVWEEFKPLADYVKEGDRVLDLGCGNGRLIELFNDKKIEYMGIDVSEKLIDIAKRKYSQNNFQIFDGLKITFADNSFNVVFCIAVLHHIPSAKLREEFLKEAYRVLKPNSYLILSVWYLWQKDTYWWLFIKETVKKVLGQSEIDWFDIMVPWGKLSTRYFHNFRRRELKRLAEDAGFKIEKIGILQRGPKNKNILVIAVKSSSRT